MDKRFSGRARQRGAAAIEFGLVFVLFFAIFYGAVSYSLPLLMMQSFNHAASESVRQALALIPESADYQAAVTAVVERELGWLPAYARDQVQVQVTPPAQDGVLAVRISYPYLSHPLVPSLSLPGIGTVPSLPDSLEVSSSLKLSN